MLRKMVPLFVSLIAFVASAYGQSSFNGSWLSADFPGLTIMDFHADGAKLTGSISRLSDVYRISDGVIAGNTATFEVSVLGGARTITFTATQNNDTLALTRSVRARDEASNVGTGLYGAKGPMQFSTKRDSSESGCIGAMYGNWRENDAKSTFVGGAPQSVVPQIISFAARSGGAFEFLGLTVNSIGAPAYTHGYAKFDGKDYPDHRSTDVTAWLNGGQPTFPETVSPRSLNPRTCEWTVKARTVVVAIQSDTVSADGNTMTETTVTVDAQGKQSASKTVVVFDRIP